MVDENLLSVGRRSALQSVSMLLIHLYKRAQALGLVTADGLHLPVTQQHIADALGLSLVHTNKTLRRLKKLGLFQFERRRFTMTRPTALEELADYWDRPVEARPLI